MKNRRIIRSQFLWMRSYVIVTVLMIVLLLALITWMVDKFTKEIEKMNHGLTSVLQTSIDTRLNDIDHFTAQLQMNPVSLKMGRIRRLDEIDKASLIRFSRQLYDYKLSNAFIKEIYIYYPRLDLVAGDLGYFNSEQYYLLKNNLIHNGYAEWLDRIRSRNKANWHFTGMEAGEPELCLTKCLPCGLTGDEPSILTVTINEREVGAILANAGAGIGSALAAVVSDDNVFYVSVGSGIDLHGLRECMTAVNGRSLFKFQGNYGSVMESGDYNIKYVTLIERRRLLDPGYFIRNTAYAAIGLSTITGAALFVLLGLKGAKPLREILERLANRSQPGKRMVNDYDLIGSEIKQMYLKEEESSRRLKRQQEDIEELFLCGLLNSEERRGVTIFASTQKLGIQMEYSLFQAAVIRYPWEGGAGMRPAFDVVRTAVKDKEDLSVFMTELRGDLVLVFHMEPEYGSNEMKAIADELEGFLHDTLGGGGVLLAFGGIYGSMSKITVSYHEALMSADLCLGGREGIRFYEKELAAGSKEAFAYSGIMAEFGSAMLEERYEEAGRLIDLLFRQYIGTDLNVYSSRAKKYAVINSVLEALRSYEGNGGLSDKGLAEPLMERLSDAKDISDTVRLLHEGMSFLILLKQKQQDDLKENLAERAKKYIDLNFKDPMIGLYSISDYLEVSNTYLSTTFKRLYGVGLSQYINKMRIACARRLLIHSEKSIKEIGLSVGFSSDAVFIRVFKQYENTTPGRLRKNRDRNGG